MVKFKELMTSQTPPRILTYNGAEQYSGVGGHLGSVIDYLALLGGKHAGMYSKGREKFLENTPRNQSEKDAVNLFAESFAVDPVRTLRGWFRARNCRSEAGGLGMKRVIPLFAQWLIDNGHIEHVIQNLPAYATYGSWRDVVLSWNMPSVQKYAADLMNEVLQDPEAAASAYRAFGNDINAIRLGLLVKYLPRQSSGNGAKGVPGLAAYLAEKQGHSGRGSEKWWRKYIGTLAEEHRTVEHWMCTGQWDRIASAIDSGKGFGKIPSQAYNRYMKAWRKHLTNPLDMFIAAAKAGMVKGPNAKGLFPWQFYPLFQKFQGDSLALQALDLQWTNMPRKLADAGMRPLWVLDSSSSMNEWGFYNEHVEGSKELQKRGITPYVVGAMMMLFAAEQSPAPWNSMYGIFATGAQFHEFRGQTAWERYQNIHRVCGSTNYLDVHKQAISMAVSNSVSRENMYNVLGVITDGQFDRVSFGYTAHEAAMKLYDKAGYARPLTVYWVVNAYSKDSPVRADEKGTILLSGFDMSVMEFLRTGEVVTPQEFQLRIVDDPYYDRVIV